MNKYCIVSATDYFKNNIKKKNFIHIINKKDLNLKKLNTIKPSIIFVPHWHWKINKEIFDNYTTIIFHSTPLPFGRGGSPIQNMILNGFSKTKICAIEARDFLDSGNIYLKKNLSLKGNAQEIYKRMYKIITQMIFFLISKKLPIPKPQKGKITYFKRRKENESLINFSLFTLIKVYDHIRMLDLNLKKFPKAHIKIGLYKLSFSSARKVNNKKLKCLVEIQKI
jgi:methionyl-tRNA formyltransferase